MNKQLSLTALTQPADDEMEKDNVLHDLYAIIARLERVSLNDNERHDVRALLQEKLEKLI